MPEQKQEEKSKPFQIVQQRADGAFELYDDDDLEPHVVALTGKKPSARFFLWKIWMESRRQTALLQKMESSLGFVEVCAGNAPDFTEPLAKLTKQVERLASHLDDIKDYFAQFEENGFPVKTVKK